MRIRRPSVARILLTLMLHMYICYHRLPVHTYSYISVKVINVYSYIRLYINIDFIYRGGYGFAPSPKNLMTGPVC
jgi:hypothetical protein